eukprot:IDg3458t1
MKEIWLKHVFEYSNDMFGAFKKSNLRGEDLWFDFTSTFREHTIMNLSPRILKDWIELLRGGGVYVKKSRGYPRSKALIECLRQDNFIPYNEQHAVLTAQPIGYNLRSTVRQPVLNTEESGNNRLSGTVHQFAENPIVELQAQEVSNDFGSRPDPAPNEQNETEKAEGIPVMLKDDALSFYI